MIIKYNIKYNFLWGYFYLDKLLYKSAIICNNRGNTLPVNY